jgi:hypothetical protein
MFWVVLFYEFWLERITNCVCLVFFFFIFFFIDFGFIILRNRERKTNVENKRQK